MQDIRENIDAPFALPTRGVGEMQKDLVTCRQLMATPDRAACLFALLCSWAAGCYSPCPLENILKMK